jgi:hypothetical protein
MIGTPTSQIFCYRIRSFRHPSPSPYLTETQKTEEQEASMDSRSRRVFDRDSIISPLQYEIPGSGQVAIARMYNISRGGAYFETICPLSPEDQIDIALPIAPYGQRGGEDGTGYLAKIRWCRRLGPSRRYRYGIGAAFLKEKPLVSILHAFDQSRRCDLCGEQLQKDAICRIDGTLCLCIECSIHIEELPDGTVRECVARFLNGNVL